MKCKNTTKKFDHLDNNDKQYIALQKGVNIQYIFQLVILCTRRSHDVLKAIIKSERERESQVIIGIPYSFL